MYYVESKKNKGIFSSIMFNHKETYPISPDEEDYILNIFNYFDIEIQDAYIQTEIDSYGDKYIDMFVIAIINDIQIIDSLEDELESLHDLFEIDYKCTENSSSRTYDFYHYFVE